MWHDPAFIRRERWRRRIYLITHYGSWAIIMLTFLLLTIAVGFLSGRK